MSTLTYLSKAESYIENDQFQKALPFLKKAERSSLDRFLSAEILWLKGETLRHLGQFEKALFSYWESHRLYRLLRITPERLRTLLGASACLRILGRYLQAQKMWKSVRQHVSPGLTDPSYEEIQLEIALVERGLGNHGKARTLLKKCLGYFQKNKDIEALQHTWWALGGVERFSGSYGAALKAFEKAEYYAKKIKDPSAEAYALCGQGGCRRILGQGKQSFQNYKHAHQILKKIKDLFGTAYGLCGMGNAERVYGSAQKTLALYQKSASLYKKVGDEGSRAFAFWGLGGSYRRLKKYKQSFSYYQKALKAFQAVDDHRGLVMTYLGLCRLHRDQGLLQQARIFLRKAKPYCQNKSLIYEAALLLLEKSFLRKEKIPTHLFKKFGIKPSALSHWQDLP